MKILIVDDDRSILRTLSLHLSGEHEVETAAGLAGARERLRTGHPDLLVLDLKLPDGTGIELLRELREAGDLTPVLLVTGQGELESAIEAMREGATDYIRKPIDIDEIDSAIARVARTRAAAGQGDLEIREDSFRPGRIAGSGRAILGLLKRVGVAAQNRVTVLVLGESGTGKELVARTIHAHSTPGQPFVGVNCSAIVPTLLESELFGHELGAFTGALSAKAGKLELAGEGTIFLDEVGDLSLDLQAKLLRVLQEREFERVGGTATIPLRARILAATNHDLQAMVKDRSFREDLYYRLAVDPIRVPALRDRLEDLPDLVEHILGKLRVELKKGIRRVTAADMERLRGHSWPGNVRELENVLTACALSTAGETLDLGSWSPGQTRRENEKEKENGKETKTSGPDIPTLAESEREQVLRALETTGWNITRASALLGISRPTLRKKIAQFGLREKS